MNVPQIRIRIKIRASFLLKEFRKIRCINVGRGRCRRRGRDGEHGFGAVPDRARSLAQDQWALRSQQRFAGAQAAGKFKVEIVPVQLPGRKGPIIFEAGEHNRPDTTLEKLAALKPAFRQDGSITAGNAPGLNSGAAAVVLADRAWSEQARSYADVRLVSYGIPGGAVPSKRSRSTF